MESQTQTQTQAAPQAQSLFALLALASLASLASAAFSVWVVVKVAAQQWAALQPDIYAALLHFVWRGVLA
jgi:hypothetical protein